ncbi:MAG: LytTR family DNA-binding domain-containing protein [Erysipelotrichaceae bacterium]
MLSIKIAICDDNKTSQVQIYEVLKKYFAEQRIRTCFCVFNDGKELLESSDFFDIIILDIKMEEIDGIMVKDKLYSTGNKSKIIFLSGYSTNIQQAFGRNVYGFVNKDKILDILYYIDLIIEEFKSTRLINLSGYLIDVFEIRYIEADRVYSKLYTNEGEYKLVRKSLKEIEELLINNASFVRTHRSYIVNLSYVKAISAKQLELDKGMYIPISDSYLKNVQEKLKYDK